jgi:metal-sulfur cluster biosynthetic enzyme
MLINAETIKEALKVVIDPELLVNIVDLGLLYDVTVSPDGVVDVLMTLTTPACPIGPQVEEEIRGALQDLPGITQVNVNWTFDPAWSMEKVTEDGRIELGMW